MENAQFILGLLASITASCLFFPQVIASYKSKKTRGIAWSSIIIGILNAIFWISYGLLKLDPFIYITNSLSFLGVFLLMVLKIKFG